MEKLPSLFELGLSNYNFGNSNFDIALNRSAPQSFKKEDGSASQNSSNGSSPVPGRSPMGWQPELGRDSRLGGEIFVEPVGAYRINNGNVTIRGGGPVSMGEITASRSATNRADSFGNLSGDEHITQPRRRPKMWRSLQASFPNIAAEWHPTRNGTLSPDKVAPKACRNVWWQCLVNPSHEWAARIDNRTRRGQQCPLCRGEPRRRNSSITSDVLQSSLSLESLKSVADSLERGQPGGMTDNDDESSNTGSQRSNASSIRSGGSPYVLQRAKVRRNYDE